MCVCVCRFGISFTYVIEVIDSKLISVCLINDYLLIADLHIFVYGCAKCASISLECTKVILSKLNNFGKVNGKWTCDSDASDYAGNSNLEDNDEWMGPGWYRITGDAGTRIPERSQGKDII